MSETVTVALISAAAAVLVALVALVGRITFVVQRVRADAAVTREQVANDHDTNLRVEQDERHDENAQKLDAILEEIKSLRRSTRRLWERSDEHHDAIHELERTGPRPNPYAPPPRGTPPKGRSAMSTTNPVSPKVVSATVTSGVAIAATTVAVYIIETAARIDIPSPVEGAVAILIGAAGAFVGGYIKRDPARHVA